MMDEITYTIYPRKPLPWGTMFPFTAVFPWFERVVDDEAIMPSDRPSVERYKLHLAEHPVPNGVALPDPPSPSAVRISQQATMTVAEDRRLGAGFGSD